MSKWLGWIGLLRRRARFSSPAHAQVWFEWQQHGRSLPALMGFLLPFELSLLFLFRDTPVLVAETLAGVLPHPAVHGRLRRRDGPQVESARERIL